MKVPRYMPDWPLPGQPYRPGPSARPPEPELCVPAHTEDAFLYAVDLFNHGHPWQAHEIWEQLWRTETQPARRAALQSLILWCAARIADARHSAATATRLRGRAADKLLQAGGPEVASSLLPVPLDLGKRGSEPALLRTRRKRPAG